MATAAKSANVYANNNAGILVMFPRDVFMRSLPHFRLQRTELERRIGFTSDPRRGGEDV